MSQFPFSCQDNESRNRQLLIIIKCFTVVTGEPNVEGIFRVLQTGAWYLPAAGDHL